MRTSRDDVEAIRKREDEFLRAHAFNDGAKLAEFYTNDALLIPPNEPMVRGKQAIAEWYQREFEKDPPIENPTVILEENLRFICICRKRPDGSWVFYRDIWNTYAPIPREQ
jgi:ketosteroid isomerase-like protein